MVLLASAPPTFAAVIDGVLIDDFIVPQTVEVTTTATAIGFNATSASGITAIGGERELYVRKTAGGNGERVRSRVNPDGLNINIEDANGLVQVIYDGIDGGPPPTGTNFPTVNYNGLGGIDLTDGLDDAFFELLLTFSDIGGPLILTVYEQGGAGSNYAQTTFALPGGVPAGSSVILAKTMNLSNFLLSGTSSLEGIFTNAGAIVMEINATAAAQQGWDMRIDYLKTRGTEPPTPTPTPIPATLTLLGAGLLGLRFARRRSQ